MIFVKIMPLFSDSLNRTIEHLAKVYTKNEYLKEKISYLFHGIIEDETIRGKKVLLKPNWVSEDKKLSDKICLRTSDSIILATLELILEKKPASVTIGDSPIQGCSWTKMLSSPLISDIERLSVSYSVPVTIKDFRRTIFDPSINSGATNHTSLSEYVIFDLGKDSTLETISITKNIFRVTDYDPDRLAQSHIKGTHKYCITKDFFDADIIISLPKIKTHQKTGITGALKNIVGLNGDKDFLPHHRIGGIGFGGDCYPGKNVLRRLAEWFLDSANRHHGKRVYIYYRTIAFIIWKLSMPNRIHQLTAGWYGNDTCWRMVIDLNKIAIYGKSDGSLSEKPQREIYSLCDGIIGGQGDGPLNPEPLPLGVISFSNDSSMNDVCMATLMGLETCKIPLLKNASELFPQEETVITFDGLEIRLSDLMKYSIHTQLPEGWVDYQKQS